MQKQAVTAQKFMESQTVSINFVTGVSRLRIKTISVLTLACGHTVSRPGARTIKSATCKQCPSAT